jgi:Ser/Thr protein kinase RdoA (MazF antagonist)
MSIVETSTSFDENSMPNAIARLIDLVEQAYAVKVASLQPLNRLNDSSGKLICRVKLSGGHCFILRLYPAANAGDVAQGVAAMLLFLEEQDYPAERIIRPEEKAALVTTPDGSQLLMTTCVEGTPTDYSPTTLHALGATLGRLHALRPGSEVSLPLAAMRPVNEIPWAAGQLTRVEAQVPASLRSRYEMILAALHAVDYCEDLPRVLIHNDCFPGNSVCTAAGEVVLIDWEGAGFGPAVLDVGFLLISCESASPWTPPFPPDPKRVAAVIDGYCQHHRLAPSELDKLPDAIRFRSIVYGAVSFAETIASGEDEPNWWWWRYSAAEEVAERARKQFESYL